MTATATVDIAIFGGGVAGLWTLNRLRKLGLTAVLFETHLLGGAQTQHSQGIIHGGMKYALQGILTQDAKALASMPDRFHACLAGVGEIDLSDVSVLSDRQYLWSTNRFTGKLTGFMAQTALRGQVERLQPADYPTVFQDSAFKGEVYALAETVLDVPSLVAQLSCDQPVYKIDAFGQEAFQFDQGHLRGMLLKSSEQTLQVQAQSYIFTAGAGNEKILAALPEKKVTMQRRPLHMVLVKMPFQHAIFGHCLGIGARPRMTITSHRLPSGEWCWYLGGNIAEEGVKHTREAQILLARKELQTLFPWLDFSGAEFATLTIDRAEAKHPQGLKPESSSVECMNNIILGWPTKLVLAPNLADEVIAYLNSQSIQPRPTCLAPLFHWPRANQAKPIGEMYFAKTSLRSN
ncbi:MAG: FAD-dependent oxidoreductase [Gammaproteobacteria bacterium]|nr:FAD-dependent oxidoreductase [Gammaproteobacteria bacterium]